MEKERGGSSVGVRGALGDATSAEAVQLPGKVPKFSLASLTSRCIDNLNKIRKKLFLSFRCHFFFLKKSDLSQIIVNVWCIVFVW